MNSSLPLSHFKPLFLARAMSFVHSPTAPNFAAYLAQKGHALWRVYASPTSSTYTLVTGAEATVRAHFQRTHGASARIRLVRVPECDFPFQEISD